MLQRTTLVCGLRWVSLALALALLGSVPAQAAFILGGNTHPEFPGTNSNDGIGNVNGFINFAVYGQGGGGGAGDTYGTGVANADTILAAAGFFNGGVPQAAPPAVLPGFIYLFQVLNARTNDVGGGPAPPISSATLDIAGTISGFGTLASTPSQPLPGIPIGFGVGLEFNGVFLQGGNIGDPGMRTFGPPAPAGNQSPAVIVVGGASAGLSVIATNNGITTLLTSTSLQENFAPFGSIAASGRSYLFGYSTSLPPNSFTTGSLQDHGTSAVGTVPLPGGQGPSPVPEPSTILMVSSALPLALAYLRRRNRGTLGS